MRRALAILKYVPAVLCGLLVVAWVRAEVSVVTATVVGGPEVLFLGVRDRNVEYFRRYDAPLFLNTNVNEAAPTFGDRYLGRFRWSSNDCYVRCKLPLIAAITLLLPVTVAPYVRFRFPLWSYFAWTALVAAELAYYLRA